MKRVKWVVIAVTLYVIVFQLAPWLRLPDQLVYGMFLLSPFLLLWMVRVIQKHGKPSKHRFDERLYEDLDYTPNGKDPN